MSVRGTINEQEFRELCDVVFNGRESIWSSRDSTNPGLDDKIALLQYLEQRVWDKVIHAPRVLIGDISMMGRYQESTGLPKYQESTSAPKLRTGLRRGGRIS